MENLLTIFTVNLAATACMMAIGWLLSLLLKNVTVADALWGAGFILISWLTFGLSEGWLGRKLLIASATTVWGIRLIGYMIIRNLGKKEDPRYGKWRKKYGSNFWIVSLYKVFLIQALFLWIISLSLQYGIYSPLPQRFTFWDAVGFLLWLVGLLLESIADKQLYDFKADKSNENKVMDQKLWAYCRHPNYFGEILVWWGIFFIGFSSPGSFWTVISPLLITLVLIKMTGVPLTEKVILENKPGYENYMKKTNAIFPWPPKKKNSKENA